MSVISTVKWVLSRPVHTLVCIRLRRVHPTVTSRLVVFVAVLAYETAFSHSYQDRDPNLVSSFSLGQLGTFADWLFPFLTSSFTLANSTSLIFTFTRTQSPVLMCLPLNSTNLVEFGSVSFIIAGER
jgi:hypothetical protein